MKGSELDFIHLLRYKFHKRNPNCGGSYIDSPDWTKNNKATINLINKKDNKFFQYPLTVELNHEKTKGHSERMTKIKPFINKLRWEGKNYPSEKVN